MTNPSTASTVKQSIWQNRNFVILLSTGFLLSFGSRVYELALPLIIYELTQSSVAMGTMRALQFLPIFLFGMVIGVFVDRADKKRCISGPRLPSRVTAMSWFSTWLASS